eukprot:gene8908-18435_t
MDDLFENVQADEMESYDNFDENEEEISQEDAWIVINTYFTAKGLVRQQLDSFDEFVTNTIQELVDDAGEIKVTPQDQHIPGQVVEEFTYIIKFEQIYVGNPVIYESDAEARELYPHEARLRQLTYSAPIYVDVTCKQFQLNENRTFNPNDEPVKSRTIDQNLLAYLPIMLRSKFCHLHGKSKLNLSLAGECVFDQGGYFVINGSEKVIIAQERMSNNHVYVFKKQQPSKYEWVCETRSHINTGARPTSTMYLQMYGPGKNKSTIEGEDDGHKIRSTLPYIRTDIPVVIIFRALGFVADRDIIEHVVYDFNDTEMMERFRPSLEEAKPVQNQIVALDYIGKRGSALNVGRRERVGYARDILQKEVLPHVGIDENNETKKAFFLGYIIHKMLMCSMGRLEEDDRDHFGKKRLDLAGPLLGGLFRLLFKKLTKFNNFSNADHNNILVFPRNVNCSGYDCLVKVFNEVKKNVPLHFYLEMK